MAKKYKAVNTVGTVTYPDSITALTYTVPTNRTAKLTFASTPSGYSSSDFIITVKPSGSDTPYKLFTVEGLSKAVYGDSRTSVNCVNLGVYFNSGDQIGITYKGNVSTSYNFFLSFIEEYEEA